MNQPIYPIIFTTESFTQKQKRVFIGGIAVGLIIAGLGIAAITGILSSDVSGMPLIIVGGIVALVFCLFYLKVSNAKTNVYSNVKYIIDTDSFTISYGDNKPQDVFPYKDYIIATNIVTVRGNSNCHVVMEDKNGKKKRKPCMLSVPVFKEFARAVHTASN